MTQFIQKRGSSLLLYCVDFLFSEEYVLINPHCCLPEFIIHLQFVKNYESSAAADSHRLYSTLQSRSHQLSHCHLYQPQNPRHQLLTPSQRKQQWLHHLDQFFIPEKSFEPDSETTGESSY